MRIIGKQLVVALASAVSPLRKPGADTVRQTPGFFVRKPAIAAAWPAFCDAAEIGDGDARHVVDRVDAVELERVDDEMKAVGQLLSSLDFSRLRFDALRQR